MVILGRLDTRNRVKQEKEKARDEDLDIEGKRRKRYVLYIFATENVVCGARRLSITCHLIKNAESWDQPQNC